MKTTYQRMSNVADHGGILSSASGRLWSRSERRIWLSILFSVCAVVYATRAVMPLCVVAVSREYQWTKTEMGSVLSAFFWGYATTQVLGGYLSDRFGAKVVMISAMIGWSALTLITPLMTRACCDGSHATVLHMFIILRVLTGCVQGVHFPSLHSMLSQRVPAIYRAFSLSFATSGAHMGTLLTGSIGSVLLERFGWESPFFLIGVLGLVHVMLLYFCVGSRDAVSIAASPSTDKFIKTKSSYSVPWLTIFTKAPFWAVFVGQFCGSWMFFILFSWLPTYFTETFPTANAWVFNAVPWLVTIPCQWVSGWLSDRLVGIGYSTIFVRKTFQTLSSCGAGVFVLSMPFVGHNYIAALFCVSAAIGLYSFHHSGIIANVQDIAPTFTGSVIGLVNTAAAVQGFVGVYVAGYLLQTFHTWFSVFYSTAAISFVGAIVYLMFASGDKVV